MNVLKKISRDVAGSQVEVLRLDPCVEFELRLPAKHYSLTFDKNDSSLMSPGGTGLIPSEKWGVDLALAHVRKLRFRRNGELYIKFDTDHVLEVPMDENYEAWMLSSSTGDRVISIPGGELAIWEGV